MIAALILWREALGMTNLVAIATEFVPQDLRVRMALTKRRYRRNWILPF